MCTSYRVDIHCGSQNVIISFWIKRNSAVITEEFQPGFDLLFFQIQISSNVSFLLLESYNLKYATYLHTLLSSSVLKHILQCKKIFVFIYNFQFTFYFDL